MWRTGTGRGRDSELAGSDRACAAVCRTTPADRGPELDTGPVEHTDLDHLIGSWQEDPEFDRAIADFERIDVDPCK